MWSLVCSCGILLWDFIFTPWSFLGHKEEKIYMTCFCIQRKILFFFIKIFGFFLAIFFDLWIKYIFFVLSCQLHIGNIFLCISLTLQTIQMTFSITDENCNVIVYCQSVDLTINIRKIKLVVFPHFPKCASF